MRLSFSTLAIALGLAMALPLTASAQCNPALDAQCQPPLAVKVSKAADKKPAGKLVPELEAVKKAIGKASCENNDQCKTVAMGAKACGGPEFFLAYSSTEKTADKVPELAQQHRIMREKEIAANGEMSDCKVVTDPGGQCAANKCVLKPLPKAAAAS